MWIILYLCFFGFCNVCRGEHFFGLTNSTALSRWFATLLMAIATGLWFIHDPVHMDIIIAGTWALLMLWCTPAWDRYWEACIGGPVNSAKGFLPVDWIMRFWPLPAAGIRLKLWGLLAMSLRMTLASPAVVFIAYMTNHSLIWALAIPLLALPYFIYGFFAQQKAIMHSEATIGAMLGFIIMLTIL